MKNKLDLNRHYEREDHTWLKNISVELEKKLERDQEQRRPNINMRNYNKLSQLEG